MKRIVLLVLSFLLAAPAAVDAADAALSEQERLLELKAAWVQLQSAAAERDRRRELRDLGLVSEAELAAAQTTYQVAQVAYQQRFLALFSATPRVAVARCLKSYQGARQWVSVTLRNGSAPALDWTAVGLVDEQAPLPDLARLREIRDVVVSLADAGGTIVSEPYEGVVPVLPAEGEATLRFVLLKDLDAVRVVLRYAGRREELPVYLEKDASANVVRMASQQFSQEADLGASAVYDLRLECYGGSGEAYALRTLGLPEEIGAEFTDPATGARVHQIKFSEGVASRALQLRVFLPDVPGERVALDRPVPFVVAALDAAAAAALPAGRELPPDTEAAAASSGVRLELLPRGVGRLQVRAPTLFAQIARGAEPARFEVALRNIGTRRVDNVRLQAEAPPDWRIEVEPALAPRLQAGEELRVTVLLTPPPEVPVGDYPVRLRTEAYSDTRRIESLDQTARVQVVAPTSWLSMGLLGLLVLGTVGGLVGWGVRLSRR